MLYRITLYEIEHTGDLDDALEALRAIGATEIRTLGVDFESAEAAGFEFRFDGDRAALEAALDEQGACY